MSREASSTQNPGGITIEEGEALTFAAPPGGKAWKLYNTSRGLVVEASDPPPAPEPRPRAVLTLTSLGAVVRGDLSVDGEIARSIHCHGFVGTWTVKAGDIPGGHPGTEYEVVLEEGAAGAFQLSYQEAGRPETRQDHQKLLYNRWTGTLDTAPGEPGQQRCISFWDGKGRDGSGKDRIFAMRRGSEVGIPRKHFLPWELRREDLELGGETLITGGDGTWGAEGG